MSTIDPKLLEQAEAKAQELLAQMTLDEKIWQLSFCGEAPAEGDHFSPEKARIFCHGIGGLQIPLHLPPEKVAAWVNDAQKWFREETRLGIPPIIFCESLHGVMTVGATVFPQAIGLGSTFNPELVEEVAKAIGTEARTLGASLSLAPDLDLARDPRWGRVEETYGEDGYLTGQLGAAYVRGLQSADKGLENSAYSATLKHFCAHGCPESGVNLSPVCGSERELRERYLPPFKAALDAGALAVMPAYSEYDGTPCHTSELLLNQVLREEWGFDGFTFSDFGGIEMVQSMHHAAEDFDDAAIQALHAGMDSDAPMRLAYGDNLIKLVEEGRLDEALIDRAAGRILRVKALLGLFDHADSTPEKVASTIRSEKHLALARRAAEESIVLLKNDGMLPLDGVKKLAVIGPNADWQETGDYTRDRSNVVTLLQALRQRPGLEVAYAPGCDIWGSDRSGFEDAKQAVLESDAAVIAVGGRSYKMYGMGWGEETDDVITCGEGFDYSDLNLSGVQEELILELAKLGKPVAVVLIDGRPSTIGKAVDSVGAVLCAWYPGELGGYALADILFGDVNPSGKLNITFPKTVGQVPMCYDYKPSARGYYHVPGSPEKPGRDYVFQDTLPLFEFGTGLSYTTFGYENLTVTPTVEAGGSVEVSVDETNTGSRSGKETVLLYLHDVVSKVTTPVKQLRRFEKLELAPGQTKTLHFTLEEADMTYIGKDMKPVLEPGRFEVLVGGLTESFTVI